MAVSLRLASAGLSDVGKQRTNNEDRIFLDPERGFFLVVDGLGGHNAGEKAAATAVEMITARLQRQTGTTEERIREAIALANNEINSLAQSNAELHGMACVATLAVVEDEQVTVGHVGDTRLYLLAPGSIQKVTPDHSPVGEREDSGELRESEAMAHPRRNEVFRDIGSEPHGPDDEAFVDVLRFRLRPDNALLLCSDGLSDLLTSEQIRNLVESNAGQPERAVRALVDAANAAGGKDNVSVIVVEGPAYAPAPPRPPRAAGRSWLWPFAAGLLAAAILFALLRPYVLETSSGKTLAFGTARPPITWTVGTGGTGTIGEALAKAQDGDTVLVEPGTYRENIQMRSGVTLVSRNRHAAILHAADVVVQAANVARAGLRGFRIIAQGPQGVLVQQSDVELTDLDVSGAAEAGVEFVGNSAGVLRASRIIANRGAGIVVRDEARPFILHNVITGNGRTPGNPRPGLRVAGAAAPVLAGNLIGANGAEQVWVSPLFKAPALLQDNLVDPGPKRGAQPLKVVP